MRWRSWMVCAVLSLGMGCSGAEQRPAAGRPAPAGEFAGDDDGVSQPAGKTAPDPASNDAPEISRSVGEPGGIVVFWPRVIPRTSDPALHDVARKLQEHLEEIARKKYGDAVDVRPEPERVCPLDGCKAATVGVLLAHVGKDPKKQGCVAIALVAKPGKSPMTLVPWAGVVRLKKEQVDFREYPESQVEINDAVSCDKLVESLAAHDKEIQAAL